MPLRYFHFQNGGATLDHVGVDLPDMTAARSEAVRTVAEILREDDIASLWNGHPFRLWVTDGPGDTGETLFALRVVSED